MSGSASKMTAIENNFLWKTLCNFIHYSLLSQISSTHNFTNMCFSIRIMFFNCACGQLSSSMVHLISVNYEVQQLFFFHPSFLIKLLYERKCVSPCCFCFVWVSSSNASSDLSILSSLHSHSQSLKVTLLLGRSNFLFPMGRSLVQFPVMVVSFYFCFRCFFIKSLLTQH